MLFGKRDGEIVDRCSLFRVLVCYSIDRFQSMCIVHLRTGPFAIDLRCSYSTPNACVSVCTLFLHKTYTRCIRTQPFVFNFQKETLSLNDSSTSSSTIPSTSNTWPFSYVPGTRLSTFFTMATPETSFCEQISQSRNPLCT
jgi:hypothetical protein